MPSHRDRRPYDRAMPFPIVLDDPLTFASAPPRDGLRHAPGARYADRYWLPILGPTAYLAAQQGLRFEGQRWSFREFFACLGVTRPSTIEWTVKRLHAHHLLWIHPGAVQFAPAFPDLTPRQIELLPEFLRSEISGART